MLPPVIKPLYEDGPLRGCSSLSRLFNSAFGEYFYSNSSMTISGFDPSRSGGPHVPAPLEVKTCILPIRLKPYTNCRYTRRAIQLQGTNWPRCVCPDSCR